ncbi:FtsK/SpoIIIE domain-containing protein [Nakamurella sp. PAMC28650]|uniref:FtsK/SpoIIIE domain-containing protein n=1 Tax=Nakamurella sp. PAMC28650 TaxID=2762325 RepID=UPI00164D1B35|nr:FtsK/SpoIIIE domain-containing protein [Nakamurella sp. PAMC28650]QNK82860.1 hypothetical protein H7F38_09410 [Nakamurella sp. PAMC28650]
MRTKPDEPSAQTPQPLLPPPTPGPGRPSLTTRAPLVRAPIATSIERGRARWPAFGGCMIVLGLLLIGITLANRAVHVTNPPRWVTTARQFIDHWAPLIGDELTAGGILVLILGYGWRLLRRKQRQTKATVMASCAGVLQVPSARLSLRRSRWTPWGRGLKRATLKYRSAEVVSDYSDAIGAALGPHVLAPVSVKWLPRRSRFQITPRPIPVLRLEDKHPELGKLAAQLTLMIGSLVVDQRKSKVAADGSVQQLVGRYANTTRDVGDGFRQRVQAVLDSRAPSPTGYWNVRWDPATSTVTVSPSQPLPKRADFPLEMPDESEQMHIPLGVGDGAAEVFWDPETFPHLLCVGPTGTGKTIFLNNLIVACAMRGWSIVLVDPKELSFRGFDPVALAKRGWQAWAGVEVVATSEAEMERGIDLFYQTMRDRYAALKHFEVREADLPPMLLIIDEAGELVERLGEYHTSEEKLEDLAAQAEVEGRDPSKVTKPKGTKNPELRKIWSGLRLGRQGRTFVVTATQRPDVSYIPGEARSNLTTRVGLGHLDGAALEMVFNTRAIQQRVFEYELDPRTGQRRKTRVRGRATVDVGKGPQTIQTFWVPDPAKVITGELTADDAQLITALQELVSQSADRWSGQTEVPKSSGGQRAAAIQTVEAELEAAADSQDEADSPAGADLTEGMQLVPGNRLQVGQIALLEVDCVKTLVEIQEIEGDQDYYVNDDGSVQQLVISYEVVEGPNVGGSGMTWIPCDEEVYVETS